MNESYIMACTASALQFIVAGYALRLNRRYGTARVGWSLFCAFSLLALLQIIQSTVAFNAGATPSLEIHVTYVLIAFLLLIGMLHLEAMLKERSRMEHVEKQLRAELESEVKLKTAHLTRAIEELMSEMEETKRMSSIIETSQWTKIGKTVVNLAPSGDATTTVAKDSVQEAIGNAIVMRCLAGHNCEGGQILAGVLGGEWVAHF